MDEICITAKLPCEHKTWGVKFGLKTFWFKKPRPWIAVICRTCGAEKRLYGDDPNVEVVIQRR